MSIDNLEKLNYGLPLVSSDVVGVPANGDNGNTTYHSQSSLKRPRTEDYSETGLYSSNKLSNYLYSESRSYTRAKTFLTVRHNNYVYHTEEWKPKGCTMYLPLCEDIMINTQNIEQISFESDQFFLADEKGNYVGAKPVLVTNRWIFIELCKAGIGGFLYICLDLFFSRMVFASIVFLLWLFIAAIIYSNLHLKEKYFVERVSIIKGNAVHLWRFDPSSRKLYISRSILFLKEQDYQDVQFQLDNL